MGKSKVDIDKLNERLEEASGRVDSGVRAAANWALKYPKGACAVLLMSYLLLLLIVGCGHTTAALKKVRPALEVKVEKIDKEVAEEIEEVLNK